MKSKTIKWLLLSIPLLLSGKASASTYIFATAPGATVSGFPVDITVTFIVDPVAQTITIQPENLQADIIRDIQALSSMQITLSNLNTSTTAPSVISSSYSAFNIDRNGVETSTTATNHWGFPTGGAYSVGTGSTLTFCTNCPTGGNIELLIGAPGGANGTYSDANGSVTNGAHNPWILACATVTGCNSGNLSGLNSTPQWILSVPQLTSTSAITAVTFGYGTGWGTWTSTSVNDTPTPEPGSLALMLAGAAVIGFARYRRRSI